MAMVEINKNPSRRELTVFISILPVFFGIVGALRWRADSTDAAIAIWSAGGALSLMSVLVPPLRRVVYIGWMYAVYPIAWTVSHVILSLIYFVVATPIGLIMRAVGRDPMLRTFDKTAKSYWVLRQPAKDTVGYFRQF